MYTFHTNGISEDERNVVAKCCQKIRRVSIIIIEALLTV